MAELTPKTISELPEASSVSDSDIFPLSSSATSKRVTFANLFASLKTRGWYNIAGNTNRDFSLANNEAGFLVVSGVGSVKDIVIYMCSSTGVVNFTRVLNATAFTVTASANNINLANNSGAYMFVYRSNR